MRFEKKKLAKMIDELSSYCLEKDAQTIKIELINRPDRHLIHVHAEGVKIAPKEFDNMHQRIRACREVEMEEYYWSLVGDCVTQDELSLVACMTDEAVASLEEDVLEIKLVRLIR